MYYKKCLWLVLLFFTQAMRAMYVPDMDLEYCSLCQNELGPKKNLFIFDCEANKKHHVHVTCLWGRLIESYSELQKVTSFHKIEPKSISCYCPLCLKKGTVILKPLVERCERVWRSRNPSDCFANLSKLPQAVFVDLFKKNQEKAKEEFSLMELAEKRHFLERLTLPERIPFFKHFCALQKVFGKNVLSRLKRTIGWSVLLKDEDISFLIPIKDLRAFFISRTWDIQLHILSAHGRVLPKKRLLLCMDIISRKQRILVEIDQKIAELLKTYWEKFSGVEKQKLFCLALVNATSFLGKCSIFKTLWGLLSKTTRENLFGFLYDKGDDSEKAALLIQFWVKLPEDERQILLNNLYNFTANNKIAFLLATKFGPFLTEEKKLL